MTDPTPQPDRAAGAAAPDPRVALDAIADVLRGRRPDTDLWAAIRSQPRVGEVLLDYIERRFVACSLAPAASEQDGPFWEVVATVWLSLDQAEQDALLELVFLVRDPRSVYHVLGPLLQEVYFPSMLEPVLLRKVQSEDPRVVANARELDYFVFQARRHFKMSEAGRAQFDACVGTARGLG